MKRALWPLTGFVPACLLSSLVAAQGSSASPQVLAAMQHELARSVDHLKGRSPAAYFISYLVTENKTVDIEAAYGDVTSSSTDHHRVVDVDVRVGSPAFDNTHPRTDVAPFSLDLVARDVGFALPIEDNRTALDRLLWYATNRAYNRSLDQFTHVSAGAQVHVAAEDTSPDFSSEPAVRASEPPAVLAADTTEWKRKVALYSAPFARYGDIYGAWVTFNAVAETRWYVNSEGSAIQTPNSYYRLLVYAYTKASDGMLLPRYLSYTALEAEGLPPDSTILDAINRLITDLHALKTATVQEAYTGPAILSGRASAVFFHEVFGHRIEGHRQKDELENTAFKDKIGQQVLPTGFLVYSDPTLHKLDNVPLAGSYDYDDEGVKARRVDIVRDGILTNFLLSRSPVEGFPHSNGHGRAQAGWMPEARQSNLVVTSSQPVTRDELKHQLIDLIAQEHRPYGLYFDDIEGGFTMLSRNLPGSFDVMPVMVYRVYPDGHEELVRGADLIGTPLTVFSRILAADGDMQTFNGLCGAESGWVPVSSSSPDLLIGQIEVQRKDKSHRTPPILPPPSGVIQ